MAQDRKDQSGGGGEAERWPSVRQDDAVERTGRTEQVRSFDPDADAPTPGDEDIAQGEGAPPATNEGKLGPAGDPAEGKRR